MIDRAVVTLTVANARPEDLARAVQVATGEQGQARTPEAWQRWQAILDAVEDALWQEFDRLSDRVCQWCGYSMESGSLRCWTHETCRCATLGRMECFIHNPPPTQSKGTSPEYRA